MTNTILESELSCQSWQQAPASAEQPYWLNEYVSNLKWLEAERNNEYITVNN